MSNATNILTIQSGIYREKFKYYNVPFLQAQPRRNIRCFQTIIFILRIVLTHGFTKIRSSMHLFKILLLSKKHSRKVIWKHEQCLPACVLYTLHGYQADQSCEMIRWTMNFRRFPLSLQCWRKGGRKSIREISVFSEPPCARST